MKSVETATVADSPVLARSSPMKQLFLKAQRSAGFVGIWIAFIFAGQLFAQNGTWTTKAPMPTARWGAAVSVVDGVLYVVGGEGDPKKQLFFCFV